MKSAGKEIQLVYYKYIFDPLFNINTFKSKMTEENDFPNQIENNKNKNNIKCQYCNSLMLKTESGTFIEQKFALPLMHQKRQVIEIESEELDKFWCVDDMFTFENIGFSNTIQQTKLLICADCDMGPVGYHDLSTKKSYISLARVKHEK